MKSKKMTWRRLRGKRRNKYEYVQNILDKSEKMIKLRRARSRLEGDIKIDLKTCDKRMKDWINLAQDRNR
jgi:hypothetical protein